MPQYLILKLDGDDPSAARIAGMVITDDEPGVAIGQGHDGEGRYAVLDWDDRVECELRRGPVEVATVEDAAARVAEVAETPTEALSE